MLCANSHIKNTKLLWKERGEKAEVELGTPEPAKSEREWPDNTRGMKEMKDEVMV